jgi:hypothetical protein
MLEASKRPEVILPMDRSDIREYTGLTLSAVSRAFRSLTARRVIRVWNRRHVSIIDRAAFEKIAGDPVELPTVRVTSLAKLI